MFFSSKCNFKSLDTGQPEISLRKVINLYLTAGLNFRELQSRLIDRIVKA